MNTIENYKGEVIDFAQASKAKESAPAPAQSNSLDNVSQNQRNYYLNGQLLPILKNLSTSNLVKVIGYAKALLAVQDQCEGAQGYSALAHAKERSVADLSRVEDVRTAVYSARRAFKESGKRSDYITPFVLDAFHLSQEIIKSSRFDIKDIHTVELDRKVINRIKDLRKNAALIDEICNDKGVSCLWNNRNFSRNFLFIVSSMVGDIIRVDSD